MKLGRYLVGIASGLTFGLLFAPKKGSKLRKEMLSGKNKEDAGMESLKILGNAFKEAGEEVLEELKQLSKHEQVEAALEISKEKMKNYLDSLEGSNKEVAMAAKVKLEEIASMATQKATEFAGSVEKGKKTMRKTAAKKASATVKKTKAVVKKTAKKTAKKAVKKVAKKVSKARKKA